MRKQARIRVDERWKRWQPCRVVPVCIQLGEHVLWPWLSMLSLYMTGQSADLRLVRRRPPHFFSPHINHNPINLPPLNDSSAGTLARKVNEIWTQKAAHALRCPSFRLVLPDPASPQPDASKRAPTADPAVQSTEQPTCNIVIPLGTLSSRLSVLSLPSPPHSHSIPPQLHFPSDQIVYHTPQVTQMHPLLSIITSGSWLTKAPSPRSPFHR